MFKIRYLLMYSYNLLLKVFNETDFLLEKKLSKDFLYIFGFISTYLLHIIINKLQTSCTYSTQNKLYQKTISIIYPTGKIIITLCLHA